MSVNNLGSLREKQGRRAEAEALYAQAVAGAQTKLLPQHPHRLRINLNFHRIPTCPNPFP